MSQRRTVPRNSPGHSPGLVDLFSLWKCPSLCKTQCRQWLACFSGTLTMCLVGTVYGWTTTSFHHLTSGEGGAPLTLTHDEYSWSVSWTVLSSMTGSLLAAQLADRIGRKYCLVACSIMFTLGWLYMYSADSVPILYFARGMLGIAVGIARTINPMFVSEVADIKLSGSLGTLIAANVYFGLLLTYALVPSLTYTSHLLFLAGISAISILPLMPLRETPYFLAAKGEKEQASKSIAYYKGIEDPDQVKDELRALRAEARYGLHQQSRTDLLPPYSINLPLPSSSDLPPPCSTNFPPLSSRDLPPPYTGNLPLQSIRETNSDPTREVVGTQATFDLDLPSNSDSHSQSISSVHSKFKCEVRTQITGELRVEYSRVSPGSPLQTSRELRVEYSRVSPGSPLQTSRELHSQSASDLHRPSTSQIHQPPTSQIHPGPTFEMHRPSKSEIHQPSTSEIHPETTSEIHPETTSEIHPETTSEIHRETTSEIHPEAASEIHPEATSEIHTETKSEIRPEATSEIHPETTSQIHPETTSQIHRPSTSQIHRPSTSQILSETRSELHSRARSHLQTQSSQDSQDSTDISEPYMDLTKYTCLDKLRAIRKRSNRRALIIMLGLIMTQHLSGNFTATEHLQEFISRKATTTGLYTVLIWVEFLRLSSGYLTAAIVNGCGRRKLLIRSTAATCYILIALSCYLYALVHTSRGTFISFIPLIHFILYQVAFQIGLGTLPNVFLCDLFPTKLKGFVGAIVVIFDGIIGFTVSKLNQVITDNIGSFANYVFFSISCLVASVVIYLWVPETGGKTYNEIEALLSVENLNSSNEEVTSHEMDSPRI